MQTAAEQSLCDRQRYQGEPMSALSRGGGRKSQAPVDRGPRDTVALSARIIPGNEKSIYRMMNHIARRGAEPGVRHDESADPRFRSRERRGTAADLNLFVRKYFVPIHGEYRQMTKHCATGAASDALTTWSDVRS